MGESFKLWNLKCEKLQCFHILVDVNATKEENRKENHTDNVVIRNRESGISYTLLFLLFISLIYSFREIYMLYDDIKM
jgi:hypothetical protein